MTGPRPSRSLPALALVLALALLSACGDGDEGTEEQAPNDAGESAGPNGESAAPDGETAVPNGAANDRSQPASGSKDAQPLGTPLPRRNVQIYFPSDEDDDLVGEWHEIFLTVTPGDRVKQIVADLLEGPGDGGLRAVPQGTRLRQVYVVGSGVVYLDFTSELTERLGGGSMRELLTIYSIVDSVVGNIPEVHKVGILINGRPVDTLNGHVDLRRPLPPDYSLVRRSTTVEREPDRLDPESRFASTRVGAAAGER